MAKKRLVDVAKEHNIKLRALQDAATRYHMFPYEGGGQPGKNIWLDEDNEEVKAYIEMYKLKQKLKESRGKENALAAA